MPDPGGRVVLDHDPYGLSFRPFQLTPDPRFYFESATHRKAMTYLGYGLAQGEGFIVVTGEVGTGKTMLVGRLMATIDPERLTAINLVSTQVGGDDMLGLVAAALGLAGAPAAKGHMLASIERFFHEQLRAGRRTLLIVDEAQNLAGSALEELRLLSNFQSGGKALLQIMLLGQPEFREALAQPRFEQLRQRVIATHHLTAMSADEVAPYVLHRLACAGWKGVPRFTPDAHHAFHRLSGGIPRRLNMLAARVMLQGALERLTDIGGDVVEDVAAELASESIMPADGPEPAARAMASDPPAPAPEPAASAPPAYDSYAPFDEDERDAPPSAPPRPRADDPFAALPEDVPPPSIDQPPRYDGDVPPEAVGPERASSGEHPLTAGFAALHGPIGQRPAISGSGSTPPPETAVPAGTDHAARNAQLEARLAEQEAILRRTLALLVELVETDLASPYDPRDDDAGQHAA